MKDFAIIADATCDLPKSIREEYGIIIVPGHVKKPDGTEMTDVTEWTEMTREEFYSDLKKHPNDYSTSPPNISEFEAAFEKAVSEGLDVIAMTISAAISGAHGFATTAARNVLQRHPEARIVCLDSMRFGPGFGLLCVHAATEKRSGRSFDEVVAYIEENKNRFHQAGWLDDLSFVAKKGRLTHAKMFFGTLAGIKPIGEFDYNGLTTVIGKLKGAKAAYAALLDYIEKTITDPEDQIIFIAQTNRLPQAEEYRRLIIERFHPKEVLIQDVLPSCGVNVGPGLMAAYYVGKPISQGLVEERAIIDAFTGKGV